MQLRIWEERDPDTQQLIAIKNYISTFEQTRTIWMDGRPHPPEYAAHTWEGFSTGQLRRRHAHGDDDAHQAGMGAPQRPARKRPATLSEHFIRHGNNLTHISIVTDPVYLTEPLIKTQNFTLDRSHAVRRRRVAVAVRVRGRESRTVRRASCRITSSARTRTSRNSWTGTICRSTRRWAAPRRCIPSTSWSWRSCKGK